MKAYDGVQIQLHTFVNSVLYEGEWSDSLLHRFISWERPPRGARVGHRMEKYLSLEGETNSEIFIFQISPESTYWLWYVYKRFSQCLGLFSSSCIKSDCTFPPASCDGGKNLSALTRLSSRILGESAAPNGRFPLENGFPTLLSQRPYHLVVAIDYSVIWLQLGMFAA